MVPAVHIGDHQITIVFDLHALVVETVGAHEFDAPHFKPDQIIGVVDHPHLVGFRVTHTKGHVVVLEHRRFHDFNPVCQQRVGRR